MQWYLGLFPLDWLGFNAWQGHLLAAAALLINASHQALLIAIFALVYCFFLRLGGWLESLFARLRPRLGALILSISNRQIGRSLSAKAQDSAPIF